MLGRKEEAVELECPECGAHFEASGKEAAKGKVRCPNGHEFAVMGMLGGDDLSGPPARKP
jgi:hypothetical protein